jgi:hypothetical protein
MAKGLQERPIRDGVGAVGLLCPACNHWTHSYYETPEIASRRATLLATLELYQKTPAGQKRNKRWVEYQTAKSAFARLFEQEQQRLQAEIQQSAGSF